MMKTQLILLVSVLIVVAACGENSKALARTYYVSTSGKDSARGLSEKTAFRTITRAAKVAKAGDTVYIKGGNYGHEGIVISKSGTAKKPVVFQGYKDKPGDTPAQNEMPLLDGKGGKSRFGIQIRNKSHISIRNVAITRYKVGFYAVGSDTHHIVLRNITVYLNYHGISFENRPTAKGNNNTIVDCTAYNNDMCNIILKGGWTKCLIENCKSYNRKGLGNSADYNYAITDGANNNIIKDCEAGGDPEDGYRHSGHGYTFRRGSSNNKVIGCMSIYSGCEHYAAKEDSEYNEFINCIARGYRANYSVSGFNLSSSFNKVINCTVSDVKYAILTFYSPNEPSKNLPVRGNLFKNNIVANNALGFMRTDPKKTIESTKEHNNVWGNKSNYYRCKRGIGDISEDPQFVNPAAYDFHLKSQYGRWDGEKWVKDKTTSPCIDAGDPKSEYKNEPTPNGGRVNIGAYGNTPKASKSSGTTTAPEDK